MAMSSDHDEEMNRLEEQAWASGGLVGGWKFPQPFGLPDGPAVDEFGRPWHLPRDRVGLQKMLNDYIRRHGLPSRSVDTVFHRHGQLNALRVLIARGVAGERINIAARALDLGPMPPIRRQVGTRPGDPPDAQQQVWRYDENRDENTMAAVRAEEVRLRQLGYLD